jgi:hypothetical protein
LRSTPHENTGPAPVTTTAAAPSAAASSSASHSAWHSSVSSVGLACRMASTATRSFVMDSISGGLRCVMASAPG